MSVMADAATGGSGMKKPGPPVLPRRRSRLREEPSPNDLRELQTAFCMFDQNQDGKICREDLHACLQMLGQEDADDIVDKVIKNAGNRYGEIYEDSFILWMQRMGSGDDGVLRNAFQVLDRDGDGFISMRDLKDGMELLGERLSDKMLQLMFTEADRDKNGLVSYEDFVYILKK